MSVESNISTTDFSHLFLTADCEFQDVIAELGTTRFYSLTPLRSNDLDALQFSFKNDEPEKNEQANETHLLTLIGDLQWLHLTEFYNFFNESGFEPKFRLVKPNQKLEGALQFKVRSSESLQTLEALQSLIKSHKLQAVFSKLDSAPSLNKPGLLVMDMDSTAIQIECIDELAKLAGVGKQVAEVTAKAMRGELDFEQSLHARVSTLKNADAGIINQIAENLPLMPGLEDLVTTLKANNWRIAIVSGGFTAMTEQLKAQLNLDRTFANGLDVANGRLTGTVSGKVIDAQAKANAVLSLAEEFGIPMSQTVAMGDGANDLKMMAVAQLGVAFHAKPLVQAQADVAFESGGLNQLLYLLDQKL